MIAALAAICLVTFSTNSNAKVVKRSSEYAVGGAIECDQRYPHTCDVRGYEPPTRKAAAQSRRHFQGRNVRDHRHYRHHRESSREFRAATVHSRKMGKTAHVAAAVAPAFQGFLNDIEDAGARIKFMGGIRPGRCIVPDSLHPCGRAIDVCQFKRNVVDRACFSAVSRGSISRIAHRWGLVDGGDWRHADFGHFEVRDLSAAFSAIKQNARADLQKETASDDPPVLEQANVLIGNILDGFRSFLVATARPGGTMTRQGLSVAIGRLHPTFAKNLAATIKQARANGIEAQPFSCYRPPAFGVGGYRDKFNSLHAYGLACDIAGIGRPGSKTAIRFYRIAKANGVFNPYGPSNRAEFNHYQGVPVTGRAVARVLKPTITANGPKDLSKMWTVADAVIANPPHDDR